MVSGFKGWGRKITHLHSQVKSSVAFIPTLIDKLQELDVCHLTSLSLFPSSVKCCCCCYCSIANSCLILCDHMDCSTLGSSVLHYLPELAQTHVRWVGDAIQPSHPLSPLPSCSQSFPAPRSFPLNRLFRSGGQNTGASASASVFPRNIRGWFPLGLTGLISLLSKGLWKMKKLFIVVWLFPRSSPQNKDWG